MTSSQLVPTSSLARGTHLSLTSSRTVPPSGDGTRSEWPLDTPLRPAARPNKRDEDDTPEKRATDTFWTRAACRELPAEWFHPERGASLTEPRAVCATCVVRIDCLRWAIANNERFGVWGGTSERERRRIKGRLTRGEPVPELATPTVVVVDPEQEETVDLSVAKPTPATTNGNHPVDDQGRPTDVCVNCGRRYTPDRKTQRFCRKECARAWYASHPRDAGGTRQPRIHKAPAPKKATAVVVAANRICETCGDPYRPARKDQRFCSATCRQKNHNQRYYRPAAEVAGVEPAPAASVPAAATTGAAGPGAVDVQTLLGQLLAGCDHWHVEADLDDVHITISRGQTTNS